MVACGCGRRRARRRGVYFLVARDGEVAAAAPADEPPAEEAAEEVERLLAPAAAACPTARDARHTGRPRAVRRKAAAGMLGTGSQATDALLAWGLMGGL